MHGDVLGVLDSAGLVIIGFAIIETAKFIAEEEILRDKELRSAVELRRSLTKFITIIVIAASLEALVMIFETSRTDVTQRGLSRRRCSRRRCSRWSRSAPSSGCRAASRRLRPPTTAASTTTRPATGRADTTSGPAPCASVNKG